MSLLHHGWRPQWIYSLKAGVFDEQHLIGSALQTLTSIVNCTRLAEVSVYDHSSSGWLADVVTWHIDPSTYPRLKMAIYPDDVTRGTEQSKSVH